MFTNPKPPGYAFGEKLPSGHINSVWASIPKALDAFGGGAYTLGSGATLGLASNVGASGWSLSDAGLSLNGTIVVPGTVDFQAHVTFGFDVALNSTLSLSSTGVIEASASSITRYLSSSNIAFQGGSSLQLNGNISGTTGHFVTGYHGTLDSGAHLDVAGTAGIDVLSGGSIVVEDGGTIEVKANGTLVTDASSTATLNGGVTFGSGSAAQVQRPFTLSGSGHINERRVLVATDADTDFSIADGDIFIVGSTGLTANRAYTLLTTGAVEGTRMRWYSRNLTHAVAIVQPNHITQIATVYGAPTTAQWFWVDVIFNGSTWDICGGQVAT